MSPIETLEKSADKRLLIMNLMIKATDYNNKTHFDNKNNKRQCRLPSVFIVKLEYILFSNISIVNLEHVIFCLVSGGVQKLRVISTK